MLVEWLQGSQNWCVRKKGYRKGLATQLKRKRRAEKSSIGIDKASFAQGSGKAKSAVTASRTKLYRSSRKGFRSSGRGNDHGRRSGLYWGSALNAYEPVMRQQKKKNENRERKEVTRSS